MNSFQSLLCYSTPNSHPYISKKELNYLNKSVTTAENSTKKDPVPWKALLRSASVWALVWAAVSHNISSYKIIITFYALSAKQLNI